MTLRDCINLLYNLLPRGLAWNREEDSDTYKLISSIAVELCRMEDRLKDLEREIDPFQTQELLESFERMLGLPDECLQQTELSFEDRRNLVVAALSAIGGSTIEYFEKLLLTLGFEVEIIDYTPARSGERRCGDRIEGSDTYARCGSARAGDYLYNSGWQFWFNVHAEDGAVTSARSGITRCGERLATFGNERIECLIRKLKPAHTAVWFTYGV